MNKILIVGYGNANREDTGIGIILADLLAARLPHAQVITTYQMTAELAERLSTVDFGVFLDAYAPGDAGNLRCETLVPDVGRAVISPSVTPETLLTITRHLYGHCPPAVLISVEGLSFDFNDTLSPLIHHIFPEVVEEARWQIESHINFNEEYWEQEPCLNTQ